MSSLLLLLALLIGPAIMAADTGLYNFFDPTRPKPLTDKVGEVTLASQANDNRHYSLSVRAATTFSLPCTQIRLMVGTASVRFNSQGMSGAGYTSMETTINDPDLVPQVARYFNAKVMKRRHPGHRMLVEFLTEPNYAAGRSVVVTLRITNVGDAPFAFMEGGRQRGARNNQFAFSAECDNKMIPDVGNPVNYGGMASPVALRPSQSHEIKVDLAKWFKFDQDTTCKISGNYHMELIAPDDKSLFTIWEDCACAEFNLEIKL